jgi:hypothetical protein
MACVGLILPLGVAPYLVGNDRLLFATKKGPSPMTQDVELFVDRVKQAHNYEGFCRAWIKLGYTPYQSTLSAWAWASGLSAHWESHQIV